MSNPKLILPLSIATMLILSPLVACGNGSRTDTWEGTRDFSVDACVDGIIGSWESYYEKAAEVTSRYFGDLDGSITEVYDPSSARQEVRESCDEFRGRSFTSVGGCHSTAENEIRSVLEEVLDDVEAAATASPAYNFDIANFRSGINALMQLSIDLSQGLCNAGLSREGNRSEQLLGRYEWLSRLQRR